MPDAQPKTKPKACNYGLLQADGDYIVIYDAEDRPDPDQLKKAVIAFQRVGTARGLRAVQAQLLQPGPEHAHALVLDRVLDALRPAPPGPRRPGGARSRWAAPRTTSSRTALIEIGGWDPFNVTEDADLGIRLHKAGYETAMLDSTTLEEANSELFNWIRQRSRWVKGYIQTYLVHMRHPLRLLRQIGWKSFFSFQMMVGGYRDLLAESRSSGP